MIGAIFEAFPKYEFLDEKLSEPLTNIKYSTNVNLIVDLKSIIRKCYRTDVNAITYDPKIVIEDISSSILNLIGHYRNYIYKYGRYTTVYFLYSEQECEALKEIYPDYKKYYYDKYFRNKDEFLNLNNIIKATIKQIKIVCKYLPSVYYIETSKLDEFVYFNYLIRNIVNKNDVNILLSSDPVMYQAMNKNTYAIDIKGNNSSIVTEFNVIAYLTGKNTEISGNLLNLLLSLSGDEQYSINKINGYGYKKSFAIIKKLFDTQKLVDKTYLSYPASVMNTIDITKENKELLEENYKVIFPIQLQLQNDPILSTAFTFVKRKGTMKQFKELNERIFLLYPLNLNAILRGEQL